MRHPAIPRERLWVRALERRAYWDRYALAAAGFRAKDKLQALSQHRATTKAAAVERRELGDAVAAARLPVPLGPCPGCGVALEKRPGEDRPVHLGEPCLRALWAPPEVKPVVVAFCRERVTFRGKSRACPKPAVVDGRCMMCTVTVRQAERVRAELVRVEGEKRAAE